MKVLYVAELVSKTGVFVFKKIINDLKKRYPHDFLIVCADGATGGNGLGRNHAAYIHKLGANAITLGDCCFYKKDLTEDLEKFPYVLRPENLNTQAPGSGSKVFNVGNEKIAVVVFIGQNSFGRLHGNSPFTALDGVLERLRKQTPYIIVDFHAQASAEKKTLFYAADGLCSAVIGSHTRVQTADETIMPGGTAVISDAGRTGSQQSVGGCDVTSRIKEYLTGIPDWTKEAWEEPQLQGVYLDIGKDGKARSIERVRLSLEIDSKNIPNEDD
ncbi:MAG: YmdB family metallophosphoesterase [Treponema sp.]|jgi:metallophosphoesterase (TIGR00282 family)|nr:YmdB family metallophosphoesterase [Treponema sp.]